MSPTANTSRWLRELAAHILRQEHALVAGFVADPVLIGGEVRDPCSGVNEILGALGYRHVLWHDTARGFLPLDPPVSRRLEQLTAAGEGEDPPEEASEPDPAQERARRALGNLRGPAAGGGLRARGVDDVAETVYRLLTQAETPVAVVLARADLTLGEAETSAEGRRAVSMLARAAGEAAVVDGHGPLGVRNALVLLAGQSSLIPLTLRTAPGVATLEAGVPDHAERRALLADAVRALEVAHGPGAHTEETLDELAVLTDGWRSPGITTLPAAAVVEGITLSRPRDLVARVTTGLGRDHWTALTTEKLRTAERALGRHVVGQDRVVAEVAKRLLAARFGVRLAPPGARDRAPRMVLLLAGATGVGKTELARALARFVFSDQGAVIRQDMSEFAERHSAERLGGAPPGFVGHEAGGELTERVRRRPFSVVLFDEMEKAHPSTWDRMLAIIEEGRLTDGQGRTVSFADTILIFTTNIGADRLAALGSPGDPPTREAVERTLRDAVRRFMSAPTVERGLGRPELYGRFQDDILVMDVLREPAVAGIVAKLTGWIAENLMAEHGASVEIDHAALLAAVVPGLGAAGSWDGRTIGGIVKRLLLTPLAGQWLGEEHIRDATFTVVGDGQGGLRIGLERRHIHETGQDS